jgi:hypothetical protein
LLAAQNEINKTDSTGTQAAKLNKVEDPN